MSLDALLEPIPDRHKTELCKVGKHVESLAEPYKSALVNLLDTPWANGGLSDEAIWERMKKADLPVGATVINRHRTKRCICVSVVNV